MEYRKEHASANEHRQVIGGFAKSDTRASHAFYGQPCGMGKGQDGDDAKEQLRHEPETNEGAITALGPIGLIVFDFSCRSY
jgi:hypothetical protein